MYVAGQEEYFALKEFLAKKFDYTQSNGNVFGLIRLMESESI
jgi:hypothetical protein